MQSSLLGTLIDIKELLMSVEDEDGEDVGQAAIYNRRRCFSVFIAFYSPIDTYTGGCGRLIVADG